MQVEALGSTSSADCGRPLAPLGAFAGVMRALMWSAEAEPPSAGATAVIAALGSPAPSSSPSVAWSSGVVGRPPRVPVVGGGDSTAGAVTDGGGGAASSATFRTTVNRGRSAARPP